MKPSVLFGFEMSACRELTGSKVHQISGPYTLNNLPQDSTLIYFSFDTSSLAFKLTSNRKLDT